MRLLTGLALACGLARSASAQLPVHVEGFGFGAAAVAHGSVEPAAQLNASLLVRVAAVPLEANVGSSVGELKSGQGAQRDVFLSALAPQSISRFFVVGGGLALHSLATRIAGADSDDALRSLERAQSGTRLALVATSALQLPLAAGDAAALQLMARADFMGRVRQLSFGLNVALRPTRGRLTLGERIEPPRAPAELARSWDAIVQELMQLQGQATPVSDVVATSNALVIRFAPAAEAPLREAIARIARILNASNEPLTITISGPDPARLATAATAGGFPPERITLASAEREVTLQATRAPSGLSLHSARR